MSDTRLTYEGDDGVVDEIRNFEYKNHRAVRDLFEYDGWGRDVVSVRVELAPHDLDESDFWTNSLTYRPLGGICAADDLVDYIAEYVSRGDAQRLADAMLADGVVR